MMVSCPSLLLLVFVSGFSHHLGPLQWFSISLSSTLLCPICPPPLAPHFPYLFYRSLSTCWFSVFLFPGTGAPNILLSMCPSSLLLTCPYHFSLFSVIFIVTGATFTDLLACSFLILCFFVTDFNFLRFGCYFS